MPIVVKDYNKMVDDVLDRIIAANVGFTSKARGSVLRTIVEAIVAELDIQYYQLQYEYNIMDLDNATGEDLDRAVKILSVTRNRATYCTGDVTFRSNGPIGYDVTIPKGYVVSTRKDASGNIIEFVVDDEYTFYGYMTSCTVGITARNPGRMSLSPGQISVMNVPIMGIVSVSNDSLIDGGTDMETDDALKARAKMSLPALGKATQPALEGAIMAVPGVEQVIVIDQARGVATTDVSIVYSELPVPQDIQDKILSIVKATKASGIDARVVYPSVSYVDVSVQLTIADGVDEQLTYDDVGSAIASYFNSLVIGSTCVVKQLERTIMESNSGIIDMATVNPSVNVTSDNSTILRVGTITIDGKVWSNG